MTPAKIWVEKGGHEENAQMLARELKISVLLARLLTARRISDVETAQKFLTPTLSDLRDPDTFAGMAEAIDRIDRAIFSDEIIGIFGDYDVDGVCSSTILQEFFSTIGAKTATTLPSRMLEGYGLSKAGVDRLHNLGATLIITADCGTLAHEQISYAKSLNIDVVVIDHHKVSEELPEAVALVNPQRPDCASGAQFLCAAGVVFFVCIALRRHLRQKDFFKNRPEPDLRKLLDLVALATVCDVVPLVAENRIMVKAGLSAIKQGQRVGLDSLIDACGVEKAKISSTNLGFHLGPRINAAGRLADATFALKLLVEIDAEKARFMAAELNEQNQDRKDLEEQIVKEACDDVEKQEIFQNAPVLVLHNEDWHPGVVGIVASRIAEKYHKPAIIIGLKGKGSGRSIRGVDLHDMVLQASSTLSGFGGHAHAVGVTLGPSGVEKFRDDLMKVVEAAVPKSMFEKQIFYDMTIELGDVTLALQSELAQLEPFGAHNPYPVMRINGCTLRNLRKLNGGHVKGEVEGWCGQASFIGFRMDIPDDLATSRLDILAVVEKNEWQGRQTVQLRLIDYQKSP